MLLHVECSMEKLLPSFLKINSTVLQHLRVNELLRLRRVCRWTKVISDDYLLFHPRSTKTISIALNSSEDGEYESLETFLEMDTRSSIMQPSKHLQLICSNKNIPSCPCWKKPDILNILKKYGRKITHLKVSHLTIPLKDHELKFYEQLPNLKGLSTDRLFVSRISQIEFHKSFKKIEKLKIKRCNETTSSVFWEMVKFCTNLDTLVVPSNLFFNGGNIEDVGEKCKLKTINLRFQEEYFKYSNATEEIQRDFCEISVEDDLKWENVPASMFDHFMQSTLQVIAPQIVSIKRLAGFECIQETLFPCVEKVHIESPFNHYVEQNMLTKFLTAKSFPALKKLKISLRSGRFDSSDDYDLAYIWSQVPNLEEIDFTGSHDRDPTDNIFIGAGSVERNFLQLTSK